MKGNKLCPTIKKIKSVIEQPLRISWYLFLLTICFILITEGFGHLAQPNLNFTQGRTLVMRNWLFTVVSWREFFPSPNLKLWSSASVYWLFDTQAIDAFRRYSLGGVPFLVCSK